uniref:RRM domain-containing protein n=1 Tax=Cyprinus carpio TaxID=7962 RepID=A0A8C1SRA2_CYPCA
MPSFGYLFMGDLYPHVTEPFGPICFVQVCRDSKTNLSCGFRYVNLTHRQHVLNALNKDFSLYVQNMPYSLGSEELGALFSAFGEVTSATVITKKRRSMGYGFVTYSSLDDAVIATSVMNGYIVGNRPLRVTFSHNIYKVQSERKQDDLLQVSSHRCCSCSKTA